jgi:hypothetical protein
VEVRFLEGKIERVSARRVGLWKKEKYTLYRAG